MNEIYGYDEEYDDEAEAEYYAVRPNKTKIKREIAELFKLGEQLAELSAAKLNEFELPEQLHQAITEAARLPHKSARKRQLKYIAGLMHKMDVSPIIERLAVMSSTSAHAVREQHIIERWRERLLTEGNDALTELLDEHPHLDHQQLRQLIRNALKEMQLNKPPRSSRLIYQYLKQAFKIESEVMDDEHSNEFEDRDEADEFEDHED